MGDDQPLDRAAANGLRVRPWYRTITPVQWRALLAAWLGYMLDAMDFVLYLMAITTLQAVFDFGTDVAGLLATVALLASAVGSLLFGVVADRFGRTRALMGTVLVFSFCSLGTATAQNLWQLIIWRAFLGLGVGGEWGSGSVLVSETWPAEHRDKAISIMQSGWALGYLLAALIAAVVLPVLGWRWLFVAGALPALLVLWIRRAVPEPEVWLERRRSTELPTGSLRSLFGPALVGRTVRATLLFSVALFAYWGLFSWLPAFLASPVEKGGAGLSIVESMAWIVPMQLGAFAGYLSFGFLADAVGRRPAFVTFLLVSAALVPVYGLMARNPTVLLLLGPLLGYFGHGFFSLFGALLAELFPTPVRATGLGFVYSAGRAFSALAPTAVGTLARTWGIGSALLLTSAFFMAGAVLIWWMPAGPARRDLDDTPPLASSAP
jgi:MFS family permease